MNADIGFPLTLHHVTTASVPCLMAALKEFLKRQNPVCLMHPHGFYVVLLGRTVSEEWRFHHWPRGNRTVVGMPAFIHTHDRHVESRILQGELTNILYDVVEVTRGGQPLYEVGYDGDRYVAATSNSLCRSARSVKAIPRFRAHMMSGEMYRIEHHTYHEAVVSEQVATSTLVCMRGRSPGAVKVVGLEGYPDRIAFNRKECHSQVFDDQLSPW